MTAVNVPGARRLPVGLLAGMALAAATAVGAVAIANVVIDNDDSPAAVSSSGVVIPDEAALRADRLQELANTVIPDLGAVRSERLQELANSAFPNEQALRYQRLQELANSEADGLPSVFIDNMGNYPLLPN